MKKLFLSTIFAALLLPSAALAHPHVFVEYGIDFVFDQEGLAGFRQIWTFDEMFSMTMLMEFGNGDMELTPDEVGLFKKGAFDNLKGFNYFTTLLVNGQPQKVDTVTDFNARTQDGKLIYEFFVPARVKGPARVEVAIYDESYYTDVYLLRDKVGIENPAGLKVSYTADLAEHITYSYGGMSMVPDSVVLSMQ